VYRIVEPKKKIFANDTVHPSKADPRPFQGPEFKLWSKVISADTHVSLNWGPTDPELPNLPLGSVTFGSVWHGKLRS